MGTGDGAHHFGQGLDAHSRVKHLRLERLTARESEKLSREFGRAIYRQRNRFHKAITALLGQSRALEQIRRRLNDCQQIVEVVSYAAG
jgi:hypothetical protein